MCYGYNRGYSVFTKAYGANEENKVAVKFELNSQLDYYTIESIYQYVFNRVTQSGDFSYLDWCPRLPSSIRRKKTDYKILDTVIIGKKKAKVSSPEYWKQFLPCSLKSFDPWKDNLSILCKEIAELLYGDIKDEFEEEFESKLADLKSEHCHETYELQSEIMKIEEENTKLNLKLEEAIRLREKLSISLSEILSTQGIDDSGDEEKPKDGVSTPVCYLEKNAQQDDALKLGNLSDPTDNSQNTVQPVEEKREEPIQTDLCNQENEVQPCPPVASSTQGVADSNPKEDAGASVSTIAVESLGSTNLPANMTLTENKVEDKDIRLIVKDVFYYNSTHISELKKLLAERKIDTKGQNKKEELIILLMTGEPTNNDLFDGKQ